MLSFTDDIADIPLVQTMSGYSSTSAGGGGSDATEVCTVMTTNCKATKQINRNKKSGGGDSPPTYSLAQQQHPPLGHFHSHHDQHQIHLVSGSPSNLHNSASVAISTQQHQQSIVDLYHQQQVSCCPTLWPQGGLGGKGPVLETRFNLDWIRRKRTGSPVQAKYEL